MLHLALIIGLVLIVIITKLNQSLKISNFNLLLGQIVAAFVIIMVGKLDLSIIHTIYGGSIELGYLTIPVSMLFLISFTNVMNSGKVQNPLMLLLPCITFICFSISAYIMGYSFVFIVGICASLMIIFVLLYNHFSGKVSIGRTLTSCIGFIIAVLSLALIKISIVAIYIPIFTLALPYALYYLTQNKCTNVQSITISVTTSILFSIFVFVVPWYILWFFVVGLTVILVIMQFSPKYRFI